MKVPTLNTSRQLAEEIPAEFPFRHSSPVHLLSAALASLSCCLACLTLLVAAAHAQTNMWEGPEGASSWLDADNWSLGNVPNAAQDAEVDNGTIAELAAPGAALSLTIGESAGGSTVQVLSGGLLTLGSVTIGPQGTLQFSGGFVAVSTFQNDGTMLFEGSLSQIANVPIVGSGNLTMAGSGSLLLSSTNTYSGATTVSAGVLLAGSTTGFSPDSAFTVNSQLNLNGFSNTVGSLAGDGTVTNNGSAAATLAVGNDNTSTTFGGTIQDGTAILALTKVGTGTLTLTGDNTHSGGTDIDEGALQLGNGGTTGSIAGDVANDGTLIFNRSNTLFFDGVIGGTGNVQQNGTGTTVLAEVNSYSGITAINAGVLSISQDANLGTPPSVQTAGRLIFNGGTLQTTASFALNPNRGITINSGGATLQVTGANLLTYGGMIMGPGNLTKIDTGSLILTGTNSYSGGTTLNGGILAVNSDANLGTGPLNFNGGTLQALAAGGGIDSLKAVSVDSGGATFLADAGTTSTLRGVISGVGALTKAGPGTLILTGDNNYNGGDHGHCWNASARGRGHYGKHHRKCVECRNLSLQSN